MLRTNSKEVKAKVRQYIIDGFQPEEYGYEQYYNVDNSKNVLWAYICAGDAESCCPIP